MDGSSAFWFVFITFQEEQKEFGCQEICEVTTRERKGGKKEKRGETSE